MRQVVDIASGATPPVRTRGPIIFSSAVRTRQPDTAEYKRIRGQPSLTAFTYPMLLEHHYRPFRHADRGRHTPTGNEPSWKCNRATATSASLAAGETRAVEPKTGVSSQKQVRPP